MAKSMQFNLIGLKKVFWGLIVDIFSTIFAQTFNASGSNKITSTDGIINGFFLVIAFIGFFLIIRGLSELKNVSQLFRRARRCYLISILFGIIGVTLSGFPIYTFIESNFQVNYTMLNTAAVGIILFAIGGLSSLLATRNIMLGCAAISTVHKDTVLAKRCRKSGNAFVIINILGIILFMAFSISALAFVAKSGSNIYTLGYISSLALVIGVVIGFIIMFGLTYILILVRINAVFVRFHEVEIKQSTD